MKYLAIDFGSAHLGFAVSNGDLSAPVTYSDKITKPTPQKLLDLTLRMIKNHHAKNIIIGVTSGSVELTAKTFGDKIHTLTDLPVFFQEEEQTTRRAVSQMIAAHKKKSARRTQDHSLAAANILQDYLDNKLNKANDIIY